MSLDTLAREGVERTEAAVCLQCLVSVLGEPYLLRDFLKLPHVPPPGQIPVLRFLAEHDLQKGHPTQWFEVFGPPENRAAARFALQEKIDAQLREAV